MTCFHHAISPLHMIKDVITTNWDDFFERECRFDAFVYDSDLAFWDAAKRRIMKIHGSITQLWINCWDDWRLQPIVQALERWSVERYQLKSLVARKTVIYVGYSCPTKTTSLIRNVSKLMQGNLRQAYFISPKIDRAKLSKAPISLIPIETDGSYFFERAREELAGAVFRDYSGTRHFRVAQTYWTMKWLKLITNLPTHLFERNTLFLSSS